MGAFPQRALDSIKLKKVTVTKDINLDDVGVAIGLTPAHQGLVGDGSTDDTGALQTLLNAGGTIRLPAGNFKITWTDAATFGVQMAVAGTRLVGAGVGKTVLEIEIGSPSTTTTRGIQVAAADCWFQDLTIQQDALPARGKVERLVELTTAATNCRFLNVDILGTVTGATYSSYPTPVSHIEGDQGATIGLYLDQADGCTAHNLSCSEFGAGEHRSNAGSYGLQLESCRRCSFHQGRFNNNFYDGVKITDSQNRNAPLTNFVDCYFNNNGQVVPLGLTSETDGVSLGNGNGIDIDGSHVRCTNCVADGNYGANFQVKNGQGTFSRTNVVFDACVGSNAQAVGSAGQAGFSVFTDGAGYVSNTGSAKAIHHVIMSNCDAHGNSGHGFDINVGLECQIRGGTSRSNGNYGFRLGVQSARCEVTGLQILGNGTNGSGGAYAGFVDDGINHRIHDNHISGIDSYLNGDTRDDEYEANTIVTYHGIVFRQNATAHDYHYCYNNTIEHIVNLSGPDHRFAVLTGTPLVKLWGNYELGSTTEITTLGTWA